jgi:hypothetical protein
VKTPRAIMSPSIFANQSSTWLSAEILLQELPHKLRLVGGEIVENNVDLLAGWAQGNDFLQKGNEVLTGVACGGLSMDTARGSIQRCIQRERSMPVVFEPMALDAAENTKMPV